MENKMINQAVLFCGGYGTRFNDKKKKILKPLAKVNGLPILRIIIDIFFKQGISNFLLLGGYKFSDLKKFERKYSSKRLKIFALNTGIGSSTAERLLRAQNYLEDNFFLTYGDSIANFSVKKFKNYKTDYKFYVSTYEYNVPYGVFYSVKNSNIIKKCYEKNFKVSINAGFYVLNKNIFKFIKSKNSVFEKDVLNKVAKAKNFKLVKNKLSFWMPMDYKQDISKIEKTLRKKKKID